jgi:hypothetical protein
MQPPPPIMIQSPDGTVRHAACIPMCTHCRVQCRQPLYRRGVSGVYCSAACIDECDPSVPRCCVCAGAVTGECAPEGVGRQLHAWCALVAFFDCIVLDPSLGTHTTHTRRA